MNRRTLSRAYRAFANRLGRWVPYQAVRVRHQPKCAPKVLILGIYLADRLNTAEHLMKAFQASRHCRVEQRWVALNGKPSTDLARRYTVEILDGYQPKFTVINSLLRQSAFHANDYLI